LKYLDDHGVLSPLGALILSAALLATGQLLLPAFSLVSELRRSAARLEETLYLLSATHQVAFLKEEELQAVNSRTFRGGVRMRVRRLEKERLEVTLIPRSAESLRWRQEATETGALLAGEQAGRGMTLYVDLEREEPR
jgi:hypothetical protein